MYLPFVFGRQSELRALSDVNKKYTASGRVVPIIEPVVAKPNDLLRCLGNFGKSQAKALVIVNPSQGDFKKVGAKAWRVEVDAELTKYPTLMPAFQCGPKTSFSAIDAFLSEYDGRQVGLVYYSPSLTDAEVKKLAGKSTIDFHISLQGKMTSTQRSLLPISKAIDVIDHFNKQDRNSDYSGAELFTDRHKTYSTTGIGFGDYTVTGSTFQPGGGKPAAVAIHATFKNPKNKDVWVEHFVSDDIDIKTGSANSKYLEAVAKLALAVPKRSSEFGKNAALTAYIEDYKTSHFSGLGKSKERQIYHHIAVMHDIIHGTL
ncbi:hypothetical protein BLA9940_02556 [Burkholderia aenigmatica]|uniref:sce7725 family protein n=1 Tax=Burkholderia cepacia complex TaxID=87882 RepID=UPI000F08C34C|nr:MULTISPECIES: sce7725 family protein [Burkholderia cepacia complex]AYQ37042.1 hypothetical protein CVS37_02185 [Burkholderia lata]VWC57163.1 hypothetical protein BLA9940_02556 [Burkholderia aenigmatica]